MPFYEYQCEACGHEFEAMQSFKDEPLTECPECKKPELRKKVSAPAFRLKGGGWYETDFKSGKKKNLAGDEKAKKDSDSSSSKKTEKSSTDKKSSSSSSKSDSK